MAFPGPGGTFAGLGPTPGSTALDTPPPSPTTMGGVDPNAPFSMQGVAGQIPSGGMPPEVLTGITQSAQAMSDMLDSWAQITPNYTPQLGLIKDMVQQYLANLMTDGAGPTAPTATGPAFPGGGIDRGIAGAGAV
jgi:hypothetical protein